MKKELLTLAMMAVVLTSAQASVVINATNFPDEKLRASVLDYDYNCDNDGVLSDEEIENCLGMQVWGAKNLKGLEIFPNLETIILNGDEESYSSITSFDAKPFKNLGRFDINNYAITSLDLTYSNHLWNVEVNNCRDLSAIKTASNGGDYAVYLINVPKLTDMSKCEFKNATGLQFKLTGIQDIDVSNHPTLQWLSVAGLVAEETYTYELNSVNVSGCNELWELGMGDVKLQSLRLSGLPLFYALQLHMCNTQNLTVENMANLGGIECSGCSIQNLNIKNCPVLNGVGCADNNIHNLIIDDSPHLYSVNAENNKLMWLDMSHVESYDVSNQSWFRVDNQNPTVQAVKLSPTETGLLVHERFDVSRVKELRAKGLSQTPRETTVDGTRYFVFYDNGPDTPNLVGSDCGYVYETQWPYAWVEENSKDNNLPVTLRVTSWTKHQAFLKLSTTRVTGKFNDPAPAAPTVTRSQDYDGKVTFSSNNENVVKVDPNTGVLTVIGAGTATISVAGAETDYRLAPATQTYTVYIEKDEPELAFDGPDSYTITQGEAFTEPTLTNPHKVSTITYASSLPGAIAVDAETGKVTIVKPGTAEITATFAGNSNYKNDHATYRLTVNPQKGDANADGTVDVEDVVAIVNQILGSPSDNFNISASDINGDGQIDVEDVVATVNIILSGGTK